MNNGLPILNLIGIIIILLVGVLTCQGDGG